MASGDEDNHHHPIYNEDEELDFEEDDDEEDYSNPPPPLITATNPSPNGDVVVDDEDDDVDVEHNDIDDSTSSSTFAAGAGHLSIHHLLPPPCSSVGGGTGSSVTIGLPAGHVNRIIDSGVTIAATPISYAFMEEKKPAPAPIDESRRLFQRLWTDEDEIELLNGFLEYTSSRGSINSSHHHDTAAFYGQVKSKFQLDFNKNQLVEKLRRLKKKYRTIMGKITSGKEHVFKTPHEQVSFEISQKIWSNGGGGFRGGATAVRGGGGGEEGGGLDDEDGNNHDHHHNLPLIDQNPNLNLSPSLNGFDINHFEKKTPPSSRKRSRSGLVKLEDKQLAYNNTMPVQKLQLNPQLHNVQNLAGMNAVPVRMVAPIAPTVSGEETPPLVATMAAPQPETTTASGPIGVENPNPPHVASGARTETTASEKNPSPPPPVAIVSGSDTNGIEERMKNCLSPMFKELLSNVMNMNGQMGGGGGGGGGSFRGSSNGLGYAFSPMPLGLNGEFPADVKWRKQQILELEVYSKRLELVQDQIKSRLEDLRSMDS